MWEYKVVRRIHWAAGNHIPTKILNQEGECGWEAFHIDENYVYFKRQKE